MIRYYCLIITLAMTLLFSGCITGSVIDEEKARQFSEAFIEDFINDRQDAMYSKMEEEFRQITPSDKFTNMIRALNERFGKITDHKLVAHEIGTKILYNGKTKPTATMIYDVTTTKGAYPLRIVIVPNGNDLAVTDFLFTIKSQ